MDLQAQLQEIRRTRKRARRRPYRASRLDRHRAEIEKLRGIGASLEDIRLWLRRYRRIHITRRAILYRLRRWEDGKGWEKSATGEEWTEQTLRPWDNFGTLSVPFGRISAHSGELARHKISV